MTILFNMKVKEIGAWLNLSAHIQNEIGAFSSNIKYSKIFLSQMHDCEKHRIWYQHYVDLLIFQ